MNGSSTEALSMKVLILSDVHNEFSVLAQPDTDADVVILAGDIDTQGRGIEWGIRHGQAGCSSLNE